MAKAKVKFTGKGWQLPLIVEKGENGFYVVECPFFEGCYAQGKTIDEALRNIREVIAFPVNSSGQTSVMEAPSEATDKQLKELGIKLETKPKK